ncbi:MAG: DUF1329 domain-containing protein [Deltaproteobacteria bacterium]|nr:DUF1329 domain-containing protein [Deltaproteobacteria bacterium]
MKHIKSIKRGVILFLAATFLPLAACGSEALPHPDTYLNHANEPYKPKKITDDPTDLIAAYPLKDALPPEIYKLMTFDVEEAKRQTAEILGFKSPDLVGNIAPEIKPGKYTYKDVEKSPGFKELFPPEFLSFIKPGGPPLIASIPEFEIIPTRQFYWYPKLCEATRQNLGKTKLDPGGYIVPFTWQGGVPFPKPSGKFKARQVFYSFDKSYTSYDLCYSSKQEGLSFDRNLTRDKYTKSISNNIKFMGRTLFPPYGWLDAQAKRSGDFRAFTSAMLEPRSKKGLVLINHSYDDPAKNDRWMVYVPSLRRNRKLNPTDTQDPSGDLTYDDISHISQKITPERYPYKFEIIEEREYLMPIEYNTGKVWIDSKNGYALREVQFMRRLCYVLQMTQLDNNYVYSKRILYIDKETFRSGFSVNYDQNGRLYRTQVQALVFMSDTGQITTYGTHSFQFDHLDLHSSFQLPVPFPASFARRDFSIEYLINRGK